MILTRAVVGWFFLSFLGPTVVFGLCDYKLINSQPLRATALDVAVDGNQLWVATGYGVEAYDRTTFVPRLTASIALPGTTSRIETSSSLIYVGSGSSLFILSRGLAIISSVDVGATINDLLYRDGYVFAATSAGLTPVHVALSDRPQALARLSTSSGSAFSLARLGNSLYVADGDNSVEVFTIQIPELTQRIGAVGIQVRAVAAHAIGNTTLYFSDGLQTEVYSGEGTQMTRIGLIPFQGSLAFSPFTSDVLFMAGMDRRLRAVELATSTVVMDAEMPVTGGNVNRVQAVAATPDSLYVAAGDLGFLTYDLSRFRTPYPLHVYRTSFPARSVVESGANVFASFEDGVIRYYLRGADSRLSRQSPDASGSLVHDADGNRALTSTGATLAVITGGTNSITSTTLRTAVRHAVMIGTTAFALLQDASVWRVDFAVTPPASTQVNVGGQPSFIVRDGNAIALADLLENGTTNIRYFANGDLSGTPQVKSIQGAATSGIAVSAAGTVAAGTFLGVSLIDFPSGNISLLPDTDDAPTRDLHISGDDLYILTQDRLQVWSVSRRELAREFDLPADGIALHRSADEVTIVTNDGLITIATNSTSQLPELVGQSAPNTFHRKLSLGGANLYLFDGRNIDVYSAPSSGFPHLQRRLGLPGNPVDIAASSQSVFVLFSSGKVAMMRPDGTTAAETTINEGPGVQVVSIRVVSEAVWVSILKGCPAACEQKTLVLDSRNGMLVQSSSLPGGTIDVAVQQNTAYSISDNPFEIRVLNIADPFHPVITTARASEGSPASIAFSAARQTVYVLGERLYGYSAASLSTAGTQLDPYVSDPATRLGYLDQAVRMVDDCAVISGRSYNPELRSINGVADWRKQPTPAVPSPGRSIAVRPGTIYLLTDHSLEVWSTSTPPPRRRVVRP